MMLEIFKTNVHEESDAKKLVKILKGAIPTATINFDLNDCDKVLRVEAETVSTDEVISIIDSNGFTCKVIPDKICK
jgi:tRNA G26 N,N-dimethylase Trm1